MHVIDYDSAKFTNYVKSFAIMPRVHNGDAEFKLMVELVNNGGTDIYDETYQDPNDLLHDLRNGWYLGYGMQEPAYYEAVRDLTTYVDGLADAGISVARIYR